MNEAEKEAAELGFKHRSTYRHWHKPWRVIWILVKWQLGFEGNVCQHCGFHEATHYNYALEWDIDNYPCTFETLHPAQLKVPNTLRGGIA